MSWTIRLYGCSTDNDGVTDVSGSNIALKTSVEALTGVAYMAIDILGMYPRPVIESRNAVSPSGIKTNTNDIYMGYEIEQYPKKFPTVATAASTYYNTNILSSRYVWVWFNDYPITITGIDSTKVLRVNITGYEVESDVGSKFMRISIETTTKTNG